MEGPCGRVSMGSMHGLAWARYNEFERGVWVYWRVEMWRAWEARFTPEGRRRRAEGRWRRDRKVDKVWWRWGRRKGLPPHYGYRERWWTWLAGVRGLVGILVGVRGGLCGGGGWSGRGQWRGGSDRKRCGLWILCSVVSG